MAKAFYHSFDKADGQRFPIMQIKEYDTDNGVREVRKDSVLIYHSSLIVRKLFDSIHDALKDLNSYGKEVLLPSGETVRPSAYNGLEDDLFIPWWAVKGEVWPGESTRR